MLGFVKKESIMFFVARFDFQGEIEVRCIP